MADTNYTIDDLWEEYNEEVIEATKGLAKEKAEEKALDLAVDFFAEHCSEDITGMDSDTYKLVSETRINSSSFLKMRKMGLPSNSRRTRTVHLALRRDRRAVPEAV